MITASSFRSTTVSVEKSMADVDRLLSGRGVRESRYTHQRPLSVGGKGDDGIGRLVYEFVQPEGPAQMRRGVRVVVPYREEVGARGGRAGVTAEQAARALVWHLKAKFDAVDFGIESFDVAFMPYLVTAIGGVTFAEQPALISEVLAIETPSLLALPEGRGS